MPIQGPGRGNGAAAAAAAATAAEVQIREAAAARVRNVQRRTLQEAHEALHAGVAPSLVMASAVGAGVAPSLLDCTICHAGRNSGLVDPHRHSTETDVVSSHRVHQECWAERLVANLGNPEEFAKCPGCQQRVVLKTEFVRGLHLLRATEQGDRKEMSTALEEGPVDPFLLSRALFKFVMGDHPDEGIVRKMLQIGLLEFPVLESAFDRAAERRHEFLFPIFHNYFRGLRLLSAVGKKDLGEIRKVLGEGVVDEVLLERSLTAALSQDWLQERELRLMLGNTPLSEGVLKRALVLAAEKGNRDAVRVFLERFPEDQEYLTALKIGAKKGHTQIVIDLLKGNRYASYLQALEIAVQEGHEETVRGLIRARSEMFPDKADQDRHRKEDKEKIFFWAANAGNLPLIRAFFKDQYKKRYRDSLGPLLFVAIEKGNLEVLAFFVSKDPPREALRAALNMALVITIREERLEEPRANGGGSLRGSIFGSLAARFAERGEKLAAAEENAAALEAGSRRFLDTARSLTQSLSGSGGGGGGDAAVIRRELSPYRKMIRFLVLAQGMPVEDVEAVKDATTIPGLKLFLLRCLRKKTERRTLTEAFDGLLHGSQEEDDQEEVPAGAGAAAAAAASAREEALLEEDD